MGPRAIGRIRIVVATCLMAGLLLLSVGCGGTGKLGEELPAEWVEHADQDPAWRMYGHDPSRRQLSPVAGPKSAAVKWCADLGPNTYSCPIVSADGSIYLIAYTYVLADTDTYIDEEGQWRSSLLKFDETGNRALSMQTRERFDPGSVAIADDGTVYEATDALRAYGPNGTELWVADEQMHEFSSRSAPLVADDGSIVVRYDTCIGRFDDAGNLLWRIGPGYATYAFPAMDDRGVLYAWHDSYPMGLHAVSSTGELLWQFEVSENAPGTEQDWLAGPVVGLGSIILAGYTNTRTTHEGWRYIVDGWVVALDLAGSELWRYHTDPALGPGDLAVGPDGSVCFGLKRTEISDTNEFISLTANGAEKWRFVFDGLPCHSAPVIGSDGTVYALMGLNELYAIRADGSLIWQQFVGQTAGDSSLSIGPDGTLYVACQDAFGHDDGGTAACLWALSD